MKNRFSLHRCLRAAVAVSLASQALASYAAPVISRRTPPSELFASGNAEGPIIARFLPGQRFDLQATVRPDAGQKIVSVTFAVDGDLLRPSSTVTSLRPATALTAVSPDAMVASVRAYSNRDDGVHTLTAMATQSDGQIASASGNFEIVEISHEGRTVKNVISLLGDGMGAAHRTAARIMARVAMPRAKPSRCWRWTRRLSPEW